MTSAAVKPIRARKLPLSAQAQQYLLQLIREGFYRPGQRLPSEADLAKQLGISRPTLREALFSLEQEGLILVRHGVGTFVAPDPERQLDSGLERLESVLQLAARQGMEAVCADLEVQETQADRELAGRLQIELGTPVTSIRRVILVDGSPAALMVDLVPGNLLSAHDVNGHFSGSVLDVLRQKPGLQVGQALARIVALGAEPSLARKLGLRPQQAVLLLEETLFDVQGTPIDFARNYFVPERFQFQVVRR